MGNSVVDLGAAAAEGIASFASSTWDYLTGAPEATASGYYKQLGPGARQYFSGSGEPKKQSILDYIGFADGGDVPLQDDGSLPGVDDLRFMTPEEVDEGSYNYLRDMEQQMMDHLAAAQSVHSEDVPMRQSLDMKRYHYEEAEKLRGQIEQFKERRASAISNYPDSETKLYMQEGQAPYVRGFPDALVEGFAKGGSTSGSQTAVDLGAAGLPYIDMDINQAFGLPPLPEQEYPGRVYEEGETITEPGYTTEEYKFESTPRYDPYQNFPRGLKDEDFGYSTPEIAMADGGDVPEEKGIGSVFMDRMSGDFPSEQLDALRTSGRMGDPMAAAIYGQEPTFMERLITDYNYPATIPMQDERGMPVLNEQGGQKMAIATDFALPEYMRTKRPRHDMPTYGELEDARAHALASAELARRYGPKTAERAGGIKEMVERLPGFGSSTAGDYAMDTRNNALGVRLLREAGLNATPQQLAKTVDREVFKQLDRILGRSEERQKTPAKDQPFAKYYFKSPEGGLDVYFPRDKEGYFDTSYIYD